MGTEMQSGGKNEMKLKCKIVQDKFGINRKEHELEIEMDSEFEDKLISSITNKVTEAIRIIEERKNYAEKVG